MEDINKEDIVDHLEKILDLSFNDESNIHIKEIENDFNKLKNTRQQLKKIIADVDKQILNINHDTISDSLVQISLNIDEYLWYLANINSLIKFAIEEKY